MICMPRAIDFELNGNEAERKQNKLSTLKFADSTPRTRKATLAVRHDSDTPSITHRLNVLALEFYHLAILALDD